MLGKSEVAADHQFRFGLIDFINRSATPFFVWIANKYQQVFYFMFRYLFDTVSVFSG
jgi:hypothetical protein